MESGTGSLSVSVEYVQGNSEVARLREQAKIDQMKITSREIVLKRHQQKLSEQDHDLAKLKTLEQALKRQLMRKNEEIEKWRKQYDKLIDSFENEKKRLKKEVEKVGLQKERVIAKGKESELELEKLRNIPLADELKKERRRADEEETMRHNLEQQNRELQERLNILDQQLQEERRNMGEFKRLVKEKIEQRNQADLEKVSGLEESLKLMRLAGEKIENETAALRSTIMSGASATAQNRYLCQNCDCEEMCCSRTREERRGSGVCFKDPAWEQNLRPHFRDIVDIMRIDSLLDHLYSDSLITVEEHRSLSQKPDKERNTVLLRDILPSKGPGSFEKFCAILRQDETSTMQGIADIISKGPPP
jgi:chromosome segregation ATPase